MISGHLKEYKKWQLLHISYFKTLPVYNQMYISLNDQSMLENMDTPHGFLLYEKLSSKLPQTRL